MIRYNGYNFTNIRNIVDAAENLHEAGKDDDCNKVLIDLANEILIEKEEK